MQANTVADTTLHFRTIHGFGLDGIDAVESNLDQVFEYRPHIAVAVEHDVFTSPEHFG